MLRKMLTAVLAVVLMVACYLSFILGQPEDTDASSGVQPKENQPLIGEENAPEAFAEAVGTLDASLLPELLRSFPAPVLLPATSGLTFVSGACCDVPFEDGMGRILTLTYQAGEDVQVTISSIYPARAISLIEKGDYRISGTAGALLAGLRSVRMENTDTIRLHAQGEEALYVLTVPQMANATLSSLTSLLGLTEGE